MRQECDISHRFCSSTPEFYRKGVSSKLFFGYEKKKQKTTEADL